MHLQALMNDEVSSMVTHMRKLMGSDHPVLRTLKRLIFHEGKNNLQVIIFLLQFFFSFENWQTFHLESKLKVVMWMWLGVVVCIVGCHYGGLRFRSPPRPGCTFIIARLEVIK